MTKSGVSGSVEGEWFHRGAGFLVADGEPHEVLTPEQARQEVGAVSAIARDFVERELRPLGERILEHDYPTLRKLLRRAGELGLFGLEVKEAHEGSDLGSVAATAVTEEMARGGDFAVTFGAHSGIGMLPIALFGTEEQKARHLPALVRGEKVAAYALTEPAAGSDALASQTLAREADGGFRLSGQKQWITNAGLADLFVVYARVGGEKFTAFLVEAGSPGLSLGPEEDKLGIRGSSTRALFLDEVPVSASNVLGQVGRGHVIAFNVLNVGRFKLAAGTLGSGKAVLETAAAYAQERRQFGRAIAEFGLIQEKLARMAMLVYTLESMVYRTAGLMERYRRDDRDAARAVGELAVECSLNKVYGSEALDWIVDEALQIHGGYGFMNAYPVSRMYRDARINRIFEGTNEINRLLVPDALMRRATRGTLPLLDAMGQARDAIEPVDRETGADPGRDRSAGRLPAAEWMRRARQAVLYAVSVVVERFGTALESQQELLAGMADLILALYAAQSVWLRARAVIEREQAAGSERSHRDDHRIHHLLAMAALDDATRRLLAAGEGLILSGGGESEEVPPGAPEQALRFRRALARSPAGIHGINRAIAAAVRDAGGYPIRL